MLISRTERESLSTILEKIKLKDPKKAKGIDKTCKLEQILAYLEIIHSKLRKYSRKRELVLVDCGAGNCYLSFLTYYFYTVLEKREVTIHCVDTNQKLMDKCRDKAKDLGFGKMFFHSGDIVDFEVTGKVDMVFSLHACNVATDKALYFGVKSGATSILSVSCCQHNIKRRIRNQRYRGITKHSVYKDKFVSMVGDSLRGLLMEMQGYKVSIFEFVSSRYTDKNIMLQANKGGVGKLAPIKEEYEKIKAEFKVAPELETYLNGAEEQFSLESELADNSYQDWKVAS